MRIAAVYQDKWTIYEVLDEREIGVLGDVKHGDVSQCLAFLEKVAENGPTWLPQNRSHHVCDDEPKIWQFDVTGTLRLLWFYDEGKVVVVASCFYKEGGKKGKTPPRLVRKAQRVHQSYFDAKAKNTLSIEEEDQEDEDQ